MHHLRVCNEHIIENHPCTSKGNLNWYRSFETGNASVKAEHVSISFIPYNPAQMSKEANIKTQKKFGEAVNKAHYEAIYDLVAEDNVDHDPAPGQEAGPEGYYRVFQDDAHCLSGYGTGSGTNGCR